MTRIISPLSEMIVNNMQEVTERKKNWGNIEERKRTIKDQSSNRQKMTDDIAFKF